MVPREGFEPPTCGIEAHRSNPLSYRGVPRYNYTIMSIIRELLSFLLGFGISISAVVSTKLVARHYGINVLHFRQEMKILILMPLLFVISRYLPAFETVFNNKTFVQHMVGGGFVSALYYIYIKQAFKLKTTVLFDFIFSFLIVSTLGSLNELLEYFVTYLNIYRVDGSDVWSDIYANSLGAIIGIIVYRIVRYVHKVLK